MTKGMTACYLLNYKPSQRIYSYAHTVTFKYKSIYLSPAMILYPYIFHLAIISL